MRGISLRWACICAALLLFLGPATGAALAVAKPFVAPVSGEVIRKFDAPSHKFGPGHRGIDYGVPPGTIVRASGEGTVTFAGQVADDGLFVTIEHPGGISTTYSYLSQIDVSKGDRVTQGQAIAMSGEGHGGGPAALHFGAKKNGDYIDPEVLLNGWDDITDLLALAPTGLSSRSSNSSAFHHVESSTPRSVGGSPQISLPLEPHGSGKSLPQIGPVPVGLGSGSQNQPPSKTARQVPQTIALSPVEPVAGSVSTLPGHLVGPVPRLPMPSLQKPWAQMPLVKRPDSRLPIRPNLRKMPVPTVPEGPRRQRVGGRKYWAGIADRIGDSILNNSDPFTSRVSGPIGGGFKEIAYRLYGGAEAPDFASQRDGYSAPTAPNDHLVVAVAGITTQTQSRDRLSALYQDALWRSLGFNEGDVFYYSYRGLPGTSQKTPPTAEGPFGLHDPYSKDDTYRRIELSARALERQIAEIHKQHPDREIDLVAHSQGGVVAQYYLTYLYDTKRSQGPKVRNFVSISSPHRGADGARGFSMLNDGFADRAVYPIIERVTEAQGLPAGSAPSSRQLNPDSEFMRRLVRDWNPSKVKTTNIATPFDLAVMPQMTRLPGARHFTAWVDLKRGSLTKHHSLVVNDPSTKELIYNALRATPSRCTGFLNAVADRNTGPFVTAAQLGLLSALDTATTGQLP
jgi:murein DD-endopeptidase MepM/ murein hydrolase activator NlpD/pimeloyl-ACP methyl ester carboxylesterase